MKNEIIAEPVKRTEKYKQTEIGMIPEDWNIQFLNELIDPNRPIRYGIVQPGPFDLYGRYMVRGQDYSFGWAEPSTLFRVSPAVEEKYKNARLASGDLILTIVGASTGHVEVVPEWLEGANITQTTARIGIKKNIANPSYCKFYLKSNFGQNEVGLYMKGAAQPGLNIGDVRNFRIILPPLSEQTAIAEALSDADAMIASLEKLIEKKKKIKQGAMQELLRPNPDSYREGWVKRKLGEIAEIVMGQSPLSVYYNSNGIGLPLVQGNADVNERKTIIRNFTSVVTKRGKLGDTIMSVRAPVGEISLATFDCCLGRGVCAIRYKNDYLHHYLIYIENNWSKISTGSTFDSVNSAQVKEVVIDMPQSEKEQVEIAKTLKEIDNEIIIIKSKLSKAILIKQGMMQNLLTGKIRIV